MEEQVLGAVASGKGANGNGREPAEASKPARLERVPRATSRQRAPNARPLILVVEDDPHDQEIYGRMLWYNGFDVEYAADGETAVQLARRLRPDLILLDLGLPRLDGLGVCRRLAEHASTARTPVIALTGRRLRELARGPAELGITSFLEKPTSPVQVLHAVEALVGRAPVAGAKVASRASRDPAAA